jgi:hypothetical protein
LSGEEEKKTTVDLPVSVIKRVKQEIVNDPSLSLKKIFLRALGHYFSLRTSLSVKESRDKAIEEIVFQAQVSDDPEDKLEFPLSVENVLALHASCHEALKKAGVPVE